MSTKAKLLSLIGVAGVGAVEIPFLLHGTGGFNSKQTTDQVTEDAKTQSDNSVSSVNKPQPITSQELQDPPSPVHIAVSRGNCEFVETQEDMVEILWSSFYQQKDDYVTLQCKDTDKNSDEQLTGIWTGLFPRNILKNEWKFRQGSSFDISTETKSTGTGTYETIFGGNEFNNSPLTGTWGERTPTLEGNKETVTVTVKDFERAIYLIFDKTS